MSGWEWINLALVFAACVYFALVARRHALGAAKALQDAKKLVATLWNRHEDGR